MKNTFKTENRRLSRVWRRVVSACRNPFQTS